MWIAVLRITEIHSIFDYAMRFDVYLYLIVEIAYHSMFVLVFGNLFFIVNRITRNWFFTIAPKKINHLRNGNCTRKNK